MSLDLADFDRESWNKFRCETHQSYSFEEADLSELYLARFNFSDVAFRKANLFFTNLNFAFLWGADFSDADLNGTSFSGARFSSKTVWPEKNDPRKLYKHHESGRNADGTILYEFEVYVTLTPQRRQEPGFEITFDSNLSPQQVAESLRILADYFRSCGGAGFEVDFEFEEAIVPEPSHV